MLIVDPNTQLKITLTDFQQLRTCWTLVLITNNTSLKKKKKNRTTHAIKILVDFSYEQNSKHMIIVAYSHMSTKLRFEPLTVLLAPF